MLEETKEVVDELMPYEDSKPRVNVARADYDSLPELIKGLASWEELIAAVEKMNSSLAKRSTRSDFFQRDEIASLGLGYKARAYLLLLIKMNCMAIQTTYGVISYGVLLSTARNQCLKVHQACRTLSRRFSRPGVLLPYIRF